jgi:aconitase A
MAYTATEDRLRKRSTPYDFIVTIASDSGNRTLYKGRSANYAKASYWQAIKLVTFIGFSGNVNMAITKSKEPYGAFATELREKKVKSLHVPSGDCIEWMEGSWSGEHLAEKLLATIPGMAGPIPFVE